MRILIAIFLGLLLTSCAGIQTVSHYEKASGGVSTKVLSNGKNFTVLDDKENSAAMVQEGFAADFGKAIVEGLTFGIADLTASNSLYHNAMSVYLEEHKDVQCRITESNYVSDGLGGSYGYEFFYRCGQGNHLDQIEGIAKARNCDEHISLAESGVREEVWSLNCGNGLSLTVSCVEAECIVQND